MMLSSLFSGGGFGGGGGGGGGGFGAQNNGMTGFETDPAARSGLGSGMGSPGGVGIFGGLMGLLSRGATGNSALAPLLMDIDGDLLRSQLWQRGMNSPGSGGGALGEGKANSVNVGAVAGHGHGSGNSNKPKSMPHMAMPFDIEFTGSGIGQPSQLEGNHPARGADGTTPPTATVRQTSMAATP